MVIKQAEKKNEVTPVALIPMSLVRPYFLITCFCVCFFLLPKSPEQDIVARHFFQPCGGFPWWITQTASEVDKTCGTSEKAFRIFSSFYPDTKPCNFPMMQYCTRLVVFWGEVAKGSDQTISSQGKVKLFYLQQEGNKEDECFSWAGSSDKGGWKLSCSCTGCDYLTLPKQSVYNTYM